jgi:site-specific recombinase XerD
MTDPRFLNQDGKSNGMNLDGTVEHGDGSSNRMAGDSLFSSWLAHRQADPYDPVCAAATRRLYGSIWKLWLSHLHRRGMQWMDASAVDVSQFLKQLKARRAKASDGTIRLVSEVSQKRYWQLLHWVYVYACDLKLSKNLPTGELHDIDRPRKLNDDPTVLDPALWRLLPRAFPRAESCDCYGIRDLVILKLLYEHGLTSEEVRGMQMDDLIWGDSQLADTTEGCVPRLVGAHIQGSRSCQERSISFSTPLSQSMADWLDFRESQAKYSKKEWVFLSDRANQISIRILFHLVSRTIATAARQANLPLPLRCGPQVIRNTVIREKLDQQWPLENIMAFAGLKNRDSVWRHAKWKPGQGFA